MSDTDKEAVERLAAELDQMEYLHRTGFPPERRGTADHFGKAASTIRALAQRCADLEADKARLAHENRLAVAFSLSHEIMRKKAEAERDAIATAMVEAAAQWLISAGIAGDAPDDPLSSCIRALTPADALAKLAEIRAEERAAGRRAAASIIAKRRDDYVNDHGSYDPSTGVTEFPGNVDEYICELDEIEEAILAAMEKEQGE